jgi:predicted lipid-binding transport protein (Tim44 family)
MKKALLFSLLAVFISVTGLSTAAEAKRFGGGMSFGKMFSKPKRFAKPVPQQGIHKSPTRSNPRAGGMMGMLGGLAVGGLLGALFFGGSFEGINLFDILLIGGVIFLIMRLMRGVAESARESYAHAGQGSAMSADTEQAQSLQNQETSAEAEKPEIDVEQFEKSAKEVFIRLQKDWDDKDFDDIRAFCTPEVANHVIQQIEELQDSMTRTEVVMVHPEVAGTWLESGLEWVAVHFQALLKERMLTPDGVVASVEETKINEVWVFQHDPKSDDPTWYLAGIQQV